MVLVFVSLHLLLGNQVYANHGHDLHQSKFINSRNEKGMPLSTKENLKYLL